MTDQHAWERAEADRIVRVQRDVEPFDSPGLNNDYRAQQKLDTLLKKSRRALSSGGGPHSNQIGPSGMWSATPVPGTTDQTFKTRNPDNLLAPYVIPAWDPRLGVVVRIGWSIDKLLTSSEFLELASTMEPGAQTRLEKNQCYWHNGAARPSDSRERWLLTQTRGQWVCVWWVCPDCKNKLEAKHPGRQCWRRPARNAVLL